MTANGTDVRIFHAMNPHRFKAGIFGPFPIPGIDAWFPGQYMRGDMLDVREAVLTLGRVSVLVGLAVEEEIRGDGDVDELDRAGVDMILGAGS